MKISIVVFAVMAAAMVAIVVVGASLPTKHTAIGTSIIRATPEQIFRLISGPQDWRTDLKEFKFYDENGRHMARETDKHGQTITYEIVQSDPPVTLKRTMADKGLPIGGSWTWRIQPLSGAACEVTITEDGEVYNPLFRFVSRFIMGHRKSIDSYLVMLAGAANQNATSAASR